LDAVRNGEIITVQEILAQEPGRASSKTPEGLPVLLLAAYYGHPDVVQALADKRRDLDIFEAAVTGKVDQLKALVESRPELANAVAPDGFQPLGLACFFGQAAAARFLLEHGAETNAPSQNAQKVMPLHSAAASRSLEIVRLLLEHGADPNARQIEDFTPLQEAASNGQIEMVALLLDHGADPNAVQKQGQTALSIAQKQGHPEVADYLIKRGARG
jgi:ankyrin repeat protein